MTDLAVEARIRRQEGGFILEADLVHGADLVENVRLPALRRDGRTVEVLSLRCPTAQSLAGALVHVVNEQLPQQPSTEWRTT